MRTEFFIALCVFSVELLAYQVSMVCAANWSRYTVVLFIFLVIKFGLSVWHHQSSHLQSVVYFICIFYPFLKLKCISGTNADICQRWTAFWFFQGILCDTPKKHRRTSRGGAAGTPVTKIFEIVRAKRYWFGQSTREKTLWKVLEARLEGYFLWRLPCQDGVI